MSNLKSTGKKSIESKVDAPVGVRKDEKYNPHLEEYKLATQVHQNYYDLAVKTVTVYLAVTGVSLGFVFRENVPYLLKSLFCWFNLIVSFSFCLAYTGFFIISMRIARRMSQLARNLEFALPHHRGLPYGVMLSLLCAVGVLIFWIMTLIFHFWNM